MRFLSQFIFKTGAKWRNPKLYEWYHFLKKSEKWTLDQLQAYQMKRLKELLIFSQTHSQYYRELFRTHSIDVDSINSFEDLSRIPTLSKNEVIERNEQIQSDRSQFDKLFFCETSGSTGQVLTFHRNENWDSANRAAIMRGYSWHGVLPWERNLYFWGYNMSSKRRTRTRFLDALQNRFRLFDYSSKTILALRKRLSKVVFIHGYSSMIYQLAKMINDEGVSLDLGHLRMIKGTSEKIFPQYHEEVKKAFGKRIISEYGAAESGIIAFECAEGNMHLNMEGCIVEADEENDGEIILTNLNSHSFPFIRYRLGDYIKLAPKEKRCSCGMHHPILEEVTGRIGRNVEGQKLNYPSCTLYYIFKNLVLDHDIKLNYQAHQYEKGSLEFHIVEKLDDRSLKLLKSEAKKYFGDDITITILDEKVIHSYDKKLKDFISLIE